MNNEHKNQADKNVKKSSKNIENKYVKISSQKLEQ